MRFMRLFFVPIAYIQLSPDCLTIKNPKSGESISEVPEVAITSIGKPKILAVGARARSLQAEPVQIINPFVHPRTLLADFTLAQQVVKVFLKRLLRSSIFMPSPRLVMHPLGEHAGGLTQIEIRALHELALGAGASEAAVWQGRALTDAELLAWAFPLDGQRLS